MWERAINLDRSKIVTLALGTQPFHCGVIGLGCNPARSSAVPKEFSLNIEVSVASLPCVGTGRPM